MEIMQFVDVLDTAERHRKMLKLHYSNKCGEFSSEEDNGTERFDIFLMTNETEAGATNDKIRRIKEIFGCNEVMYVESMSDDDPAFWSLNWTLYCGNKGKK